MPVLHTKLVQTIELRSVLYYNNGCKKNYGANQMTPPIHAKDAGFQKKRRLHQGQNNLKEDHRSDDQNSTFASIDVGRNLHQLRTEKGLSMRSLAKLSGLNVNTLSLIENQKSSPSVSTLQQVAGALNVPITAFFETDSPPDNLCYQKANKRPQAAFAYGTLADLGAGLTLRGGKPLLVSLKPQANSGPAPIVHTGHEFVFCLEGRISYTIEDQVYILEPGDSLLFEAYLPHIWQNAGNSPSKSLLIMCPADESDHPTERHFKTE
jgi:transcriptional regulator with XRE-family HTH domain